MKRMSYTSLHNHLDYSSAFLGFPDSINKVDNLIQYAYDIGLNGIAITDHEGISSYIKAEKYYNSMEKDRSFKLILGNEVYLITEEENELNKEGEVRTPYYHFVLNALDSQGNEYIRELSTIAWNQMYYLQGKRRPTFHTDLKKTIKEKGHLVGSSACIGGRLPKLILQYRDGDSNAEILIDDFIKFCIEVFGIEHFFLEVQPCKEDNIDQRYVNEQLWKLGIDYGLKCIVTTDSHYLKKEDAIVHKAFLNHKTGGDERETDKFYSTAYMMSEEELREYLSLDFSQPKIDILFANTNYIMEMVQEYSLKHLSDIPSIPENKIPPFKITNKFKKYYDEFTNISHYANSENVYAQYMWFKLEDGVLQRVPPEKHYDYLKRIDFECGEIKAVGDILETPMHNYFTTVQKIIDIIWTEGDSLVGCGRGSSGAFEIDYTLGINQIDPIPLGDLFPSWRFLSAGRSSSLADIDIDIESNKKEKIIQAIKEFWGNDHVLQCATFAQISPKTAILKGGKGLGYNDDQMAFLASLIPTVRGKTYTLEECLYGNEKKEIKPVKEFISELSKFPNLKETILGLQGVITQMGIHAGAVNIMNQTLTKTTACMIAPNGSRVSAFDLHDEEYTGTVKFDLLSIDALQKIRETLNLLLKHNKIQWKGDLRTTYEHYLHPEYIELAEPKLWDLLPKIYSCFQWDSPVGAMGINKINPRNIMELTTGNSLIRLQSKDGLSPMDMYVRYKNDINLWYQDMSNYGLNNKEQDLMKKYLLQSYGVMENQESCMKVSMDKEISGFTLAEADKLRKTIAKADKIALKETKEKFYGKGLENGCRQVFLDYIWNVQIYLSLSYSFSVIHAFEYSMIAIQELNLNYFYNTVFWNCACITTESSSGEDNENGSTDYGKMAKSIYKMKKYGIDVLPPDVNKSDISFTPIEENNTILFGLGGISSINQEIAREILEGRPYATFEQFYQYHKNLQIPCGVDEDGATLYSGSLITTSKMIRLIQGGCFDYFNPNRIALMKWFCLYENPKKESLTMANMSQCMELNVDLPPELVRKYKFKQYVLNKQYIYCKDPKFKSKMHYIAEPKFARPFLEKYYMPELKEETDYYYVDDNLIVVDKALEKVMKHDLEALKNCLNSEEVLKDYNNKMLQKQYMEMIKAEDVNQWSFLATNFYHNGEHELDGIDFDYYNISHFASLPEEPFFVEKTWKTRTWKEYALSRICGTILDRSDLSHIVDILTPDNEVVSVKFPQGQYGFYKQTISEIVNDKKKVIDENWFKRGNKIMVCGFRRADGFFAKKYKNSVFQHSVTLIDKINPDKTLELKLERYQKNEG